MHVHATAHKLYHHNRLNSPKKPSALVSLRTLEALYRLEGSAGRRMFPGARGMLGFTVPKATFFRAGILSPLSSLLSPALHVEELLTLLG